MSKGYQPARRTNKQSGNPVSLFPFLAVLLCTMGSLLGVLLIMADLAKQTVANKQSEIRDSRAELSETAQDSSSSIVQNSSLDNPEIPSETSAQHSSVSLESEETIKQKRESLVQLTEQIQKIAQMRKKLEDGLTKSRLQMSGIEADIENLRKEYQLLANDADKLSGQLDLFDDEYLRDELARVEKGLSEKQLELEGLREKTKNSRPGLAVIPHHGQINTTRYPIYILCTAEGVVLEPEGIVLTEGDFACNLSLGSPLEAALRAKREYLLLQKAFDPSLGEEPYPLILVQPEGIEFYYAARAAISAYGNDFGYKLVDSKQAQDLVYPPVNDGIVEIMNRAIQQARSTMKQIAIVAPATESAPDGPVAYRVNGAGSRQAVSLDQNSRVAQALRRSQPRNDHANSLYAPMVTQPSERAVDTAGSRGVFGGLAEAERIDPATNSLKGTQLAESEPGQNSGAGYENGNNYANSAYHPNNVQSGDGAGGVAINQGGPMIAYPAGPYGLATPATPNGTTLPGAPSNGQILQNGQGRPDGSQWGATQQTVGPESNPGTNASVNSGFDSKYDSETGANGDSSSNSSVYSDLSNWEKSGAKEGSQNSSTRQNQNQNNAQTAATTASSSPAGSVAYSSGQGVPGGNQLVTGNVPANSTNSASSVNPYYNPLLATPAGSGPASCPNAQNGCPNNVPTSGLDAQMTDPNLDPNASLTAEQWEKRNLYDQRTTQMSDVQVNQNLARIEQKEPSKQTKSLAERLGPNWATPEANNQPVSLSRGISVEFYADRFVIAPVRPGESPTTIPIYGDTDRAVEPLISAIQKQTTQWGDPGSSMYWKPFIRVKPQPGGEYRLNDLKQLLQGSGIEFESP